MPAPDRIEGCPGQYLRRRGITAGVCYGCTRYERTGPQITPRAAYSPELGAWTCPDRIPQPAENPDPQGQGA